MTKIIDRSKEKCAAPGCEKIRKYQPKTETRTAQSSKFCPLHLSRWNKNKKLELAKKDPVPEGFVKNCIHHGLLKLEQVSFVAKCPRCKKCNNEAVKKSYIKKHGDAPRKTKKTTSERRYTRPVGSTYLFCPNKTDKDKDKSELDLNFKEMDDLLIRFDNESIDGNY